MPVSVSVSVPYTYLSFFFMRFLDQLLRIKYSFLVKKFKRIIHAFRLMNYKNLSLMIFLYILVHQNLQKNYSKIFKNKNISYSKHAVNPLLDNCKNLVVPKCFFFLRS
jgi:hypothetical protein